ncbi:MAG: hypothetical protein JXB32_04995, partial [Deltaproteobacteria bacterium]|nr:hypothetical protein [Deltaproteobacteria bacterium]
MNRQRAWVGLASCAVLAAVTCEGPGGNAPCDGVDCSGRGFCLDDQGSAFCACLPGFHPEGPECTANDPSDPCAGVTCSEHGVCRVQAAAPVCDCMPGYR